MVQAMPQAHKSTREFMLPVRVYIEDTDAGGIVYYVNYLKYMERARTEWLRSFGFDHVRLAANNVQFVVIQCQVRYLKPARMDDFLRVTTRAIVNKARIDFEQSVWRSEERLCQAKISVACVRADSLKPQGIPPELVAVLTKE